MILKPKKIFVAVTNDISTDYRVHKICSYLVETGFEVLVYGRVLPNTIAVNRAYKIIRKKNNLIVHVYLINLIRILKKINLELTIKNKYTN